MLIKLLTEARKGRENSSAKLDSLFRPEDGYLQLVLIIDITSNFRGSMRRRSYRYCMFRNPPAWSELEVIHSIHLFSTATRTKSTLHNAWRSVCRSVQRYFWQVFAALSWAQSCIHRPLLSIKLGTLLLYYMGLQWHKMIVYTYVVLVAEINSV